jgi:hypothetical protein
MRFFPSCLSGAVLICSLTASAQLLPTMPAPGSLRAGTVVLVDDGSCGADKVRQVTAGHRGKGIPRQEACVDRPASTAAASTNLSAAEPSRSIHFIHMGGNDCPPCREWRGLELPKLQASPLFRSITYSYVTKTIKSPVPPEIFLPSEVQPLKAKLDTASGGRNGSPHQVLVVDGEVYDYWFGQRSAEEILASVQAITNGSKYPFSRCIRRTASRNGACEVKG